MRYYIIAGEASGDLHASNLMREIRKLDPMAGFRCWGGSLMEREGGTLVKHYREMAFMGFLEVALNLRRILHYIRYCKKDILSFDPDVVILVDYPGFNLRIARFARKKGLRVFYYISPQLWAWRTSRVKIIRDCVDRMFVILPFEKEFYASHGIRVDFVGHPLLDVIRKDRPIADREEFFQENGSDGKPVIALLPGSRKQEISGTLKTMLRMVPLFPGYRFVVAGAPSIPPGFYEPLVRGTGVDVVFDRTYDLLRHSSAAVVTSGTATLETALLKVPQVVCYKGNRLSYLIARLVVKVPFISLVNLIMERKVVQELIQNDFTEKDLEKSLREILNDGSFRKAQTDAYNLLEEKLGGAGASSRAAGRMVQYLKEK